MPQDTPADPPPGADADPQAGASLAAWLRTVQLGAVIAPLVAFIAVASWGLREAQHNADTSAERASATAHEQARRSLDVAATIANRTAEITAGSDAELRRDEAALRQRLRDFLVGLPLIVNVNVWDAEGRPLVRSDRPVDATATVADRPYFTQQRDPSFGIGISEVLYGRQTGRELMNLTVRRPSADGSFRGVVAVSLSPAYFREYYQSLTLDDQRLASFALVRSDGEILARWPPAPDGATRVPPHRETFQRLARGEERGTHVVPAEGGRETRIVSFRRVSGYPLYVVAGFSRAAIFQDWVRFLALLAAVIVPIAAVLVSVTRVALRRTRLEEAMARELRDEVRRRSAAERAMLESQKLETLAMLTGGVAHDFNNLLAILDTSLHVHRRKHAALAGEPQLLAMSRAVRTGVRLTRQLLSFSRKQALKPERVRLQAWLPAAADLVRSTLGRRIDTEFEVDPATHAILVDVAELELALINLALNARHAVTDTGRVRITARNVTLEQNGVHGVSLCVQDDGVGIPRDLLPRVIEPFFTTKARGMGSGLGLSQVHGFCSQAGGYLRIDSEPGQGTRVSLFFPAAAGTADVTVPAPLAAQAARLQGDVLLVEDNEDLARSAEALLTSAGLRVQWVKSADDALAHLAAADARPDVVLSDIAMPGRLSGIDLAFRLRKEQPGLPVLLTTGYADQIHQALAGGFEVLPKPTHPEDLLKRIAALVSVAAAGDDAGPAATA